MQEFLVKNHVNCVYCHCEPTFTTFSQSNYFDIINNVKENAAVASNAET